MHKEINLVENWFAKPAAFNLQQPRVKMISEQGQTNPFDEPKVPKLDNIVVISIQTQIYRPGTSILQYANMSIHNQ